MAVLGEVVVQVLVFSTGLLVLAYIGMGVYMGVSQRDPFTGKDTRQPRSTFQWLSGLFLSLTLFTMFLSRLVPDQLYLVRAGLLALGILFMATSIFYLVKFVRLSSG